MKVVLLKDILKLGKMDEIKEVSDGYARNYLFTHNLAVPASGDAIHQVKAQQTKKKKNEESDLKNQQQIAEKLDGYELEIKEKVSPAGSLYAAVNPQKIVLELKKKGFIVNSKQIEMQPIKEVGEYEIKIKLKHGLESDIRLIVIAK